MDWALATRFQADRDLIVETGFRTIPLDPSLDGGRTGAKAGFDLTMPLGEKPLEHRVPTVPAMSDKTHETVEAALADGAKSFGDLVSAIGSRDGRDVVRDLDALRKAGRLDRVGDGLYALIEG